MQYNQKAVDVAAEVSKAVFGKPQTIRTIWMAMLAGGHVLIEDIPGVGKTTLALAFARALELNESRVQFTPDVLPSDIVGFTVFQKETGRLVYHPGSVMCNLFLGDEINRTSSRTQSALLEVMEEGTVTVDGVTHPVPAPFTVIATENPDAAAVPVGPFYRVRCHGLPGHRGRDADAGGPRPAHPAGTGAPRSQPG